MNGFSSDGADPDKRWAVTVELGEQLYKEVKMASAQGGESMAAYVRRLLAASLCKLPAKRRKRTPDARQEAFLDELSNTFHIGETAGKAFVGLEEVHSWLQDPEFGPAFREKVAFRQSLFMERVEAVMLAIGFGLAKGAFAPLVAFLNAHHPQYGLKSELLQRILGDLIEKFGNIIRVESGPQQAEKLTKLMREQAEKKIRQFR